MTVCLVWHWTGRYGGPAAHRYFIEWFLAWFLTQKIPLTFASLPYRGGRYTITSMYAFLNYKYYLGGSFGSWYWHYIVWGAVLTGLIEAAVVALLYMRTGRSEAVHIRGITLVPARKLARKLGGRAGIRLAGIRIPARLSANTSSSPVRPAEPTVRDMTYRHELPCVKIGKRGVRYRVIDPIVWTDRRVVNEL
jgi:hypothetical protein